MTELLVAIAPLLSRSEMNALLLETTTYLESEKPEERTAKISFSSGTTLSSAYAIAARQTETSRAVGARIIASRRARSRNEARFAGDQLQCRFTQLDAQSSEGTD